MAQNKGLTNLSLSLHWTNWKPSAPTFHSLTHRHTHTQNILFHTEIADLCAEAVPFQSANEGTHQNYFSTQNIHIRRKLLVRQTSLFLLPDMLSFDVQRIFCAEESSVR